MKKNKSPIYFRYEFSDEAGRPEGGDIFQFSSLAEVQDMAGKILKVAHGDHVTVNMTIGQETPFFGFLKQVGLSRQDAEKEMVAPKEATAAKKTTTKKKPSKKAKAKKK